MRSTSQLILHNLIHNDEFSKKVIPHIKKEYFDIIEEQKVFEKISDYTTKYHAIPTVESLFIELKSDKSLNEDTEKGVKSLLSSLKEKDSGPISFDWLYETTEKYCQEKAIYNGLREAVEIYENRGKKSVGSIPEILKDALAVTFNNHIGHNYIEDASKRWEYYHKPEHKIPFKLDYLNKITQGGIARKTLNIILGGCVDENTRVKIRTRLHSKDWLKINVPIKKIEQLLNDDFEVEILGADGYQPVTEFVDKGMWIGYKCTNVMNPERSIIVNQDHLFETPDGWVKAKNLNNCLILMDTGNYEECIVEKTEDLYHIVDIQVDHPNHRYYADGFSSHNTHSGKTSHMCSLAADNLLNGEDILYITLEIAEEEIAARIDANLLDIPMSDVKKVDGGVFNQRIGKLKQNTIGRLIIKEYPPATASVTHFRALLSDLELKQNFKPSVIYLDYMNLCASARIKGDASNSFIYYKVVAEEVRGLAVEKNIAIVTGSQFNRGSISNTDPGMDGIAESIGTAFTADLMYAIIADEDMIEKEIVLIKQLKNRYDDKNRIPKFFLGFDRSHQRFYDCLLNESNDAKNVSTPYDHEVDPGDRFSNFDFG